MFTAMEGTANTTALEEDARHFAQAHASTGRSTSPCPSDGWARPRSVSTMSSLESGSADKPVSCATRETASADCATQRFIIWAATRRNECHRMTDEERLRCPLLRCTRRFTNHESMLRHLVSCDLLSSCEYLCYTHMRVERFDDSRCQQKCMGILPSKRHKMFSVAKKIISTLGHHGTGKAAAESDSLVSPSCTSFSEQDADDAPHASASRVSLFSLGGSSSVSRSFQMGTSSSSRRSSQGGSPSRSQCGGRRSFGRRSSADGKRRAHSSRPTPPMQSSPAELQSTEIVELDSKEIPAVSTNAHQSPSSPCGHTFLTPANPTGTTSPVPVCTAGQPMYTVTYPASNEAALRSPTSPASHASTISPLPSTACSPQPSTINPVQLVLSDNNANTPATALSSPVSPLQICPTPPVTAGADFPANALTVDPVQLVLPDIDTADALQQLMEWDMSKDTVTLPHSGMPGAPISSLGPPSITAEAGLPSSSARPHRPTSIASPRSKNLSPSSSVRSTTSTWSNMTSMSTMTTATTVSNVSDVSALSDTGCTNAPTWGLSNPPEGDQANLSWLPTNQSSATNAYDATGGMEFSDFVSNLCSESDGAVPEDACYQNPPPGHHVLPSSIIGMSGLFSDTSLFAQVPSRSLPDADSLAACTWGVLSSHVSESLWKLRNFDSFNNPLAAQLKDTAPQQIVDVGFAALQTVLVSGSAAVLPFDMLCLLHLVLAFSAVTYGAEAVAYAEKLFSQMLAYSALHASPDRENLVEVASLLWKLGEWTPAPAMGGAATGEHDAVVNAAKSFLDDLEIAAILGPTPPQVAAVLSSSELVARHSSQQDGYETKAFRSTVNTVLQTLSCDYAGEDRLQSAFLVIGQKAARDALPTVRRLEIELIQAGKEHLDSSAKLSEFVHRTRAFCDFAYAKHASETTQRLAFYHGSLFLLRLLFPAMEVSPVSPVDMASATVTPGDTWKDGVFDNLELGQGVTPGTETDASSAALTPFDTYDQDLVPAAEEDMAPPPQPSATKTAAAAKKKATVAVGEKCTLCNYRPKGDPEWFQGSMAKHMSTKHSEAEVYYECSVPGCKSRYRNREDNLRQHEKKVHGIGDGKKRLVQDLAGVVPSGGAAKRRKTGHGV